MASIDYKDIFESFLGNITDYNFANLSISDSYQLMAETLHKAAANPFVYRIFSSASLDDETQEFTYEMRYPENDDMDREFVIAVLAKAMVYEWIHPQVRSTSLTSQFFGGKESSFFSQANHITSLLSLEETTLYELRRLIKDRHSFFNTYLG